MPTEINVFALFNALNSGGSVRLSDCDVNRVGTGFDAMPESADTDK